MLASLRGRSGSNQIQNPNKKKTYDLKERTSKFGEKVIVNIFWIWSLGFDWKLRFGYWDLK